jgi:hypothetical protein
MKNELNFEIYLYVCIKITVQEYAKRFKHAALREAIASFLPEDGYSA